MALTHQDNARNTMVNAVTALANSGSLIFYQADTTTPVATIVLGNPAFGAAVAGVATAEGLPLVDTNVAGGTTTNFKIRTSGAAEVLSGLVNTSGADINLSSTTLNNGDQLSISTLTYTAGA